MRALRVTFAGVLFVWLLMGWLGLGTGIHAQTQGTPPEITFIDFPSRIEANGQPVSGLVFFSDPDGDVTRAEFKVIEALDFKDFTLDLAEQLKGVTLGAFEFQIATSTPQRVVLEVVLVDAQDLRSEPGQFSFEAISKEPPPRLEVEPASLSFRGLAEGPNPVAQEFKISNAGGGSLSWTAQADAGWLRLSPSEGTFQAKESASIQIRVDLAGLNVGTWQGRITITAQGAQNGSTVIPVLLTVIPGTLTSHRGGVWSVAFSPDGSLNASAACESPDEIRSCHMQSEIKLWEVATGRQVRTLDSPTGIVTSVAFSPDGKLLASGSQDATIMLWDVATGAKVLTLRGHGAFGVTSVAFSPDDQLLASGSYDKTIKLWKVATGEAVRTLSGHTNGVLSVAFSPDGKLLASGAADQKIKLWEVASGLEVRTITSRSSRSQVETVAFSPDGRLLASGWRDSPITLWEVATGQEVRTFVGHTDILTSIAFSPDGQFLASGSYDRTVRLWDVSSLQSARTIRVPQDFPTIQAAIDVAQEGDVIRVSTSTYPERLFITKSLTLVGVDPRTTIIDASTLSPDAIPTVWIREGRHVTIQGLTITGGQVSGQTAIFIQDGSHITIFDSALTHNSGGITPWNSTDVKIIDNWIAENFGVGIGLQNTQAVIAFNEIRENAGSGIELWWGSTAEISNNRIYNNEFCGVFVDETSTVTGWENGISGNGTDLCGGPFPADFRQ